MATHIPGIIFDKVEAPHPRVDSDSANYYLEFDKSEDFFSFFDNEIAFIKGCEAAVRRHDFMKRVYPKYLKEIVGLRVCSVLSNIEADDKNKIAIEMHHFPFTLFDTCEIVINHMRANGHKNINTFTVANEVIEQHRLNRIRVVFLAKSIHQKVHDEGIYINYRQGFGDTIEFINEYKDGVDKSMRRKLSEYIGWSLDHDSTDSEILKMADTMREWGNNDFNDYSSIYYE